jgi:hypothetical protein
MLMLIENDFTFEIHLQSLKITIMIVQIVPPNYFLTPIV